MSVVARQRIAEFHAEADRERQARRAEQRAERPGWIALTVVLTLGVALALLVAAGSAAAEEPAHQERLSHLTADERAVTQVLDERLLDPTAAGHINAARL
jgi:hypothetical protein